MKNEMMKKICALALVVALSCGFSANVMAAATAVSPEATEQADAEVTPYANEVVTATTTKGWNGPYSVSLNSYIGFSQTFRVTTQSPGSNGLIEVRVSFKGNRIDDGQWWMGVNDVGDWKVTLPSSGTYSVEILNDSESTVYVTMQWV